MTPDRNALKQAANWPRAGSHITDAMLRIAIENAKRREMAVESMREAA